MDVRASNDGTVVLEGRIVTLKICVLKYRDSSSALNFDDHRGQLSNSATVWKCLQTTVREHCSMRHYGFWFWWRWVQYFEHPRFFHSAIVFKQSPKTTTKTIPIIPWCVVLRLFLCVHCLRGILQSLCQGCRNECLGSSRRRDLSNASRRMFLPLLHDLDVPQSLASNRCCSGSRVDDFIPKDALDSVARW